MPPKAAKGAPDAKPGKDDGKAKSGGGKKHSSAAAILAKYAKKPKGLEPAQVWDDMAEKQFVGPEQIVRRVVEVVLDRGGRTLELRELQKQAMKKTAYETVNNVFLSLRLKLLQHDVGEVAKRRQSRPPTNGGFDVDAGEEDEKEHSTVSVVMGTPRMTQQMDVKSSLNDKKQQTQTSAVVVEEGDEGMETDRTDRSERKSGDESSRFENSGSVSENNFLVDERGNVQVQYDENGNPVNINNAQGMQQQQQQQTLSQPRYNNIPFFLNQPSAADQLWTCEAEPHPSEEDYWSKEMVPMAKRNPNKYHQFLAGKNYYAGLLEKLGSPGNEAGLFGKETPELAVPVSGRSHSSATNHTNASGKGDRGQAQGQGGAGSRQSTPSGHKGGKPGASHLPEVGEGDEVDTTSLKGSHIDLTKNDHVVLDRQSRLAAPTYRFALSSEEEKKYKAPNPIPVMAVETKEFKEREKARENGLKKLQKIARNGRAQSDLKKMIEDQEKRLKGIQEDLKGKEYTFDEKGNIILIKTVTPENLPKTIATAQTRLISAPKLVAGKKGKTQRFGDTMGGLKDGFEGASVTATSTMSFPGSPPSAAMAKGGKGGAVGSGVNVQGGATMASLLPQPKPAKAEALAQPTLHANFLPVPGVILRQGNTTKVGKDGGKKDEAKGEDASLLASKSLSRAKYMAILEGQRDAVAKDSGDAAGKDGDDKDKKSGVSGDGKGGEKDGKDKDGKEKSKTPEPIPEEPASLMSTAMAMTPKSSSYSDFDSFGDADPAFIVKPLQGESPVVKQSGSTKQLKHSGSIGSGVSIRPASRSMVSAANDTVHKAFRPPTSDTSILPRSPSPRKGGASDEEDDDVMVSSRSEMKMKEELRSKRVRPNNTAGIANYNINIRGNGRLTPTTTAIIQAALSAEAPPPSPGERKMSHQRAVVHAVRKAAEDAFEEKQRRIREEYERSIKEEQEYKANSPRKPMPFEHTRKELIETTKLHQFFFEKRKVAGSKEEQDFVSKIGEQLPSAVPSAHGGEFKSFSGVSKVK